MPKLPPFALASAHPRRKRPHYLGIFFVVFAVPLFASHLQLLDLPLFWDELGQFVPTALDIFRHGWLVTRSAVPNVHPPGVELYLALLYKLFGYSIPLTRAGMLLIGSVGLLALFLLSIELSKGTKGVPAFLPPVFLLASPLFFTQGMMAQLDMPVMTFTLLSLLFFVRGQLTLALLSCTFLVACKETGVVVPFIFLLTLSVRRQWKAAALFLLPFAVLACWLLLLHQGTGYWLGDPGFAHYNVGYALHPVRVAFSFTRRIFYLFFAEFRWVGTLIIIATAVRYRWFLSARKEWRVTLLASALTLLVVSAFGGAELERYLLPVLPVFYIAVSVALTYQRKWVNIVAIPAIIGGLIASIFWNPPYPFPFENNLAMADFVHLQQIAANYVETNLPGQRIATAWPYTAALRSPDFGYVSKKLRVVETGDFHAADIAKLDPTRYDALVVYTRTWQPDSSLLRLYQVRRFLAHFYGWQPQITEQECAGLGLTRAASWESHGQQISVYLRH